MQLVKNMLPWAPILFLGFPSCGNSPAESTDKSPDGQALYRRHCVTCHGADGSLGLNGAGDLTQSVLSADERVQQIAKGKNLMMPFEGILTLDEITAVAQFTETLKK